MGIKGMYYIAICSSHSYITYTNSFIAIVGFWRVLLFGL